MVPANLAAYVHQLRDLTRRRRLAEAAHKLAEAAAGGEHLAPLAADVMAALEAGPETASRGQRMSWAPVDLAAIIEDDNPDDGPSMLLRTDGVALAYPGKVHAFNGEPETLKSALAQAWTAEQVRLQNPVVYIDFETSARTVIQRLLALGLDAGQIDGLVRYIRPTEPLEGAAFGDLDLALLDTTLVVIDGMTEALVLHGLDPNSNRDVATFFALLPQRAVATGAAVVLIDHVTKEAATRGRYAVGAGHKLALVDVAYKFTLVRPGLSRMEVTKDRYGLVRESLGNNRAGDVVLSPEDGGKLQVQIRPPEGAGEFRPTVLMERVSRLLEESDEELSQTKIEKLTVGKVQYVRSAIASLVKEEYVGIRLKGNARLHRSVRAFRADAEGTS